MCQHLQFTVYTNVVQGNAHPDKEYSVAGEAPSSENVATSNSKISTKGLHISFHGRHDDLGWNSVATLFDLVYSTQPGEHISGAG